MNINDAANILYPQLPFHNCKHLRGHWVNEREGVFRCTGCGLTQWLPELEPLAERQITAEPRTRFPAAVLASAVTPARQVQCRSCLDMIDAYTARDWGYRCPECARAQARQSECVERGYGSDLDENDEGE